MSESGERKGKQVNVNTILNVIVLALIGWVGNSILDGTKKLAAISERLVAIETSNGIKAEQLGRIEAELSKQRQSLFELQLEMARVKKPEPGK